MGSHRYDKSAGCYVIPIFLLIKRLSVCYLLFIHSAVRCRRNIYIIEICEKEEELGHVYLEEDQRVFTGWQIAG